MPHSGFATSLLPVTSRREMSMSEALPMSGQTTSGDTRNATSSRALEDGPTLLDWLDGQTTEPSGPEAVPASHSVSQGRAAGAMTSAIFGQNSSALFVPPGPLSSWESKLRQRLATTGSMELSVTWKVSTTPAGRQLCRRVPRMRRIDATGFGSLPTPSGTSNHGKNHVAGRLDEWGGSSNYFRGHPGGNQHLPGFELWTMGFPDAWRQLMPPAMPSSRKSPRKSSAPTSIASGEAA